MDKELPAWLAELTEREAAKLKADLAYKQDMKFLRGLRKVLKTRPEMKAKEANILLGQKSNHDRGASLFVYTKTWPVGAEMRGCYHLWLVEDQLKLVNSQSCISVADRSVTEICEDIVRLFEKE